MLTLELYVLGGMDQAPVPKMRVSGNVGANATSRPPKPHPMSATSTSLVNLLSFAVSWFCESAPSVKLSPSSGGW
jgi:hypothetical protein